MINGRYSIILKTPMGAKKGRLLIEEAAGTVTGRMTLLGRETTLTRGRCEGDSFTFAGALETAIGRLEYVYSGYVDGDKLSGTVRTSKGDFSIKGERD